MSVVAAIITYVSLHVKGCAKGRERKVFIGGMISGGKCVSETTMTLKINPIKVVKLRRLNEKTKLNLV